MHSKKAIIFDLDGTILDTIGDLKNAINFAMSQLDMPLRTREDIRNFINNGRRELVRLSCMPVEDKTTVDRAESLFSEYYMCHSQEETCPFDGVRAVLRKLKDSGIKLGVVSNKFDGAVRKLCDDIFPEIDIAIGAREGVAIKPDPAGVFNAMLELGVSKEETLYVGDSDVDVRTATNAGVDCVIVLWGYGKPERFKGLTYETVSSPQELFNFI